MNSKAKFFILFGVILGLWVVLSLISPGKTQLGSECATSTSGG